MDRTKKNRHKNAVERKTRYRDLLNKTEAIHESDNVGLQTITEIGDILRKADTLDSEIDIKERGGKADETLLDCFVLSSASGVLKKCIETVDVYTTTYDSSEFTARIISSIRDDHEDFNFKDVLKLLKQARKIIPSVPQYNSIYGSYDLNNLPEPKQKKHKEKIAREVIEKKAPEKILTLEKEEEGIEEIVKVFLDVLKNAYIKNNKSPINYYDYIIDTTSYSRTIENMFYFAFLVRDGKAFLDLNERGIPVIKPMSSKELKDFREKAGKNTQIISSISMDIWEQYKKNGLLQQYRNTS